MAEGGKYLRACLRTGETRMKARPRLRPLRPLHRPRAHAYIHTRTQKRDSVGSKQKRNQKRWVHRCTGGIRLVGESGRRKARAAEVARRGLPQTKRISDEMHKAQAAGEHNLEVREVR